MADAVKGLAELREALAGRRARVLDPEGKYPAAVAAVLHDDGCGPRLLFIVRATCEGDPWSGDIAFPGGRTEEGDSGPRAAAERETREETGIDLSAGECLGRLDDVTGTMIPVVVSGFVYRVEAPEELHLSGEVQEAFWVRVADLADPARHTVHVLDQEGRSDSRPAIAVLGPGRPLLWGITYRFVVQLLEGMGQAHRA